MSNFLQSWCVKFRNMNLKAIILSTVTIALAVVYAVYFTDWFRPKNIQIITQIRPMLRPGSSQGAYPVAFGLNSKYEITSIQVYPSKALATNELTPPVWSMEGAPKSNPVKAFSYAGDVPGMKPAVAGVPPTPLQIGEEYLLIIEADGKTGKTNFIAGGKSAPVAQPSVGPPTLVPLTPAGVPAK
ncbi:MAG: hypothetical protein K0Q55_1116 [Verrucomicrobia bacterium]|nr:hypothetical protein [Verrucomicrobiota bacterium]